MYVLSLLFTPFCLAAIPENDCTIYTYESLKEKPIAVENNTRGTCPQGGGSRAFFNGPTTNESHRHDPRAMKEIMPLPNQTFKCLPNRRCEMLIQGLGIGVKDNLILTTSSCPPLKESLQQTTLAQATRTIPMFQGNPDGIAFALFELPERHLLEPGIYNVCYAPALANDGALIDYLDSKDFHYTAGTLELGEGLFQCTFEEDYTTAADDSVLPCGFKNFWDAYHIDLTWSLNSNSTETPDTGPSGDSTPGLRGQGHYALLESPGYSFGATGTLVSSPISFPTGVFCVSFKYHMYGKDVASLRVYMHNVGGDSALNGEWGSPSWVAVGNKGNIWHHGGFELHPASDLSSYQIVIEGVAGKSEMGDLGIDDVFVTAGHCPVDIRHNQPKTISNDDSPMICGEVRLNTGSNPRDKSWHVENSISCAGRGYTLADVATPTWLPCCVPHFGTYKLILEDSMGDGWTGSELEFRFFDKVVKYGKSDDFTRTGYNKAYDIIIGMVEILEVKKPSSTKADVSVRIARANSYAWCGVVQTSKDGKALDIKVDDSVLKTYGIRSENPTTKENEVKHIIIDKVLRENALYDVYCYSEVVGDKVKDDDLNSISREILATRLRLSMDVTRPEVQVEKAEATPEGNIEVQFNINESGVVWCVAEDASGEKPLETLLKSNVKKEQGDYFKQYGVEMIVSENNPSTQTMVIPGIVANSVYNVYCYSEDDASPIPNIMGVCKVRSTKTTVVSLTKIPNVTIDRRITLQQGFMIFVTLDSPGRVWCIAAPDGYGVPAQDQVMTLGATADINDVSKSTSIELRGVEPSTIYNIYCMTARLSAAEPKIVEGTSSVDDMVSKSITATSFGAYCPMDDKVQTYFPMDVGSPFQPLSPKEELDVRSFILAQGLGFNGVYRISLYIDKDAFYNFYENGENAADLPPRYARVRSGTCVNNIGLYQQYVVGPIGGTTPMTYRLMTNPVETDCGGYLPAGVFGRRLMSVSSNESSDVESNFNDFLEESFGYSFHLDGCQDHTKCLELGPVMLEEVDGCVDDGKPCIKDAENSLSSEGRVWIGLKTPDGVRLPFWFIRKVEGTVKEKIDESPMEWAHRVIFNGAVPEEFEGIIESLEVWYDGKVYLNLAELLEDESKKLFTPESFKERLRQDQIEKMRAEKRKLAPSPYAGAAGTSGPVPQRVGKRGGLEYRPVPEHIESQGRRYVVQHSPGEDLFKISYIGWEMTVTTNRDTSLRINMISFKGQRVAFELGLMEALAHYTVSERNFFFLDSWYGGLGATARRVYRGIECPKTGMSLFYDGSLCVFEQDMARPARSHWKSGILRDGAPHVALVLRQMITVSNYDYITDFRFHNTGFIDASVSFTGELYAGIEVPWYSARQSAYGAQVTGAKRLAALHAHAVCWKVDIDVGADFRNNSLLLSHVKPDPLRNGANMIDKRFAETEMEAAVMRYDVRQLVYEVVDENIRIYDNYGGYRIIPSSGYNPQHYNYELFSGPAAWAKYKILSTVFKPYEYESSLPRDNKYSKRPAVSVDRYVSDNEDLRNVDIVTWVSDGVFHVPVIEDMPLTIPIGNTLSFLVKPSNMYLEDPSMDLYNAMGGGLNDPGTCGVVRYDIAEVEPSMNRVWNNTQYY